jgi:hypothetical protein
MMIGTPPAPHRGFESNVLAFALAPIITEPSPPTFAKISETTVDGVTLVDGDLTVRFTPRVGKTQRVKLLLNEFNAPADRPARAYSFNAPQDNGIPLPPPVQNDTDTIAFELTRVAAGEYLVRAQVDGAENKLERDTNESSPTFNQYIGPKATIS